MNLETVFLSNVENDILKLIYRKTSTLMPVSVTRNNCSFHCQFYGLDPTKTLSDKNCFP